VITQFMLTKNDVTIPDALEVYGEVASRLTPAELPYVGFKNNGLPPAGIRDLGRRIVDDGRKLVIEIVGADPGTERASAELALELGAEVLIGGTHTEDVLAVIGGSGIGYHPTAGDVDREPGRVHGSIDDIVAQATTLLATPGVSGLMVLGYRYVGDTDQLLERIAALPEIKVVNAGSVDSAARIGRLADLGYWAFTIGSAVLDLALPAAPDLESQLRWVLKTAG
jgi:hypothetical protein